MKVVLEIANVTKAAKIIHVKGALGICTILQDLENL